MSNATQKEIHNVLKHCVERYDHIQKVKRNPKYATNQSLVKEWDQQMQDAVNIVDGLIESINEELGWKEVTVNSAKREKFDFLRQLVQGMEEEIKTNDHTFEMMR